MAADRQPGLAPTGAPERVKIWDPLLRGFHWLLAGLVIVNWIIGQVGPSSLKVHFWIGYAIIALLAFRLVWGLVGPRPARFASFIRGPGAILDYVRHMFRREPSHWPGHNPLGALSVIAMLTVLIFQVATGLISDPEDFINVGPFADQVASSTSKKAVGWHHMGGAAILILVVLHVAVIQFYRLWKREDLVTPMITGWKWVRRR